MQSALRSATRRAVGICGHRGVASTTTTTTTTKAATATATATASELERDWVAENEKAWVKALVQREVLAQMLAEEERRMARDRQRAEADRRLADEKKFWTAYYTCYLLNGCVCGAGLGIVLGTLLFYR